MSEKERTKYILGQIHKIEELVKSIESSDSLVQSITEAFPIIIFWVDPEGKIKDFFTLDRSMLFADPKKFLGQSVHDVLPKMTGERIEEVIFEVQRTGKSNKIEYSLPFPTGVQVFEASCFPFKGKNVFAIVKNITKLKTAEDALPIEREFKNQVIQAFASL